MQFLIDQLFPSKSSSYKSVEATTKEIAEHYDRGNGFFNAFLGEMMVRTTPRHACAHAHATCHTHTRTCTRTHAHAHAHAHANAHVHTHAHMYMCSPPRGPALAPVGRAWAAALAGRAHPFRPCVGREVGREGAQYPVPRPPAGADAPPPARVPRQIYTSAFYHGTDQTLEQAQKNKLNMICEKMHLFKPGMRHLDIGCGWGTLVRWSAKEFGAKSIGVTLSKQGAKWCRDNNTKEKLAKANEKDELKQGQCEILVCDYREVPSTLAKQNPSKSEAELLFDVISAVEMAEHVGIANFQLFLTNCRDMLKDEGLFYMQVTGLRKARTRTRTRALIPSPNPSPSPNPNPNQVAGLRKALTRTRTRTRTRWPACGRP
jgi:cyclopropane fatty-acyl-phospholipid synthase-like methyltransferase